jgi:mersacidin/lichenicidin family type 2 lantibiotic
MAIDIERAWKDPEYRKSLTAEEQAMLPPNPSGPAPTSEEELDKVVGGLLSSGGFTSAVAGSTVTLGGPTRCGTKYPDCCYNSTIGPKLTR